MSRLKGHSLSNHTYNRTTSDKDGKPNICAIPKKQLYIQEVSLEINGKWLLLQIPARKTIYIYNNTTDTTLQTTDLFKSLPGVIFYQQTKLDTLLEHFYN